MAGLTPQVEMANRASVLFSGLTLDLDVTYIIVVALLIVPFVILNGLVFQPFLKLFEQRHEQVVGALEDADRKIDEAEAKARDFEQKIEVATKKGIEARDAIRQAAAKAMNTRIDGEKEKLAGKVASALTEVEKARAESLANVESEAKRLAEATASKLLGRTV